MVEEVIERAVVVTKHPYERNISPCNSSVQCGVYASAENTCVENK